MPKKFTGENSKAAVARARKADAKNEVNFKYSKPIIHFLGERTC
jgi:hypothetical protein